MTAPGEFNGRRRFQGRYALQVSRARPGPHRDPAALFSYHPNVLLGSASWGWSQPPQADNSGCAVQVLT